jgi:hypothetical protein
MSVAINPRRNGVSNGPVILAQSGAASSVTGTTTETTLASVTIPGGMMGANGSVRISAKWSYTNSANAKNLFVKLAGNNVISAVRTTTSNEAWLFSFENRASQTLQVYINFPIPLAAGGGTVTQLGVNTAVDQVLTFSCALASAAEQCKLESYTVEVLPA